MEYAHILCFAVLGHNLNSVESVYRLYTTCGNTVNASGSCTLTCDTGSDTAIQWLNGTLSTTVENTDCSNTGTLPADYSSSCPSAGIFELTFKNAHYGRDSHEWSCQNAFGGAPSNSTNAETFVAVPLQQSSLVVERTDTSIECSVVSSPASILTIFEVISTSAIDIANETSYTRTWDGLQTILSASIMRDRSYFCTADNGVASIISTTSSPAPPTDCECKCDSCCIIIDVLEAIMFVVILILVVIFIVKSKRLTVTVKCLTIATPVGWAVFLGCLITHLVCCSPSCTPDCKPESMCTVQIIAIVFLGLLGIGDFVAAVLLIMKRDLVKKAFKGDAADGSAHTGAGAQPNGNRNGNTTDTTELRSTHGETHPSTRPTPPGEPPKQMLTPAKTVPELKNQKKGALPVLNKSSDGNVEKPSSPDSVASASYVNILHGMSKISHSDHDKV